jgi:hypothetical protein
VTVLRDLDPALPALPQAFDLELVSPRLEQVWRAALEAPVVVDICTRRDTAYERGTRCVVTYDLSGSLSGAPRHTIGAVEVTPTQIVHRLFHQDPRLPRLAAAVDPDGMQARLSSLPAEVVGGEPANLREIAPLRYKADRSCVLRYCLDTADGDRALVGKLFRDRGETVRRATVALHEASRVATQMPRILRPVAYWQDLQLLLQPGVAPGGELRALAFDTALPVDLRLGWLHDVGIGLAALHSFVRATGPPRTIQDDLRGLARYGDLLAALAPGPAGSFDEALAAISSSASRHTEPAPVASHGALRLDQLLLDERGLVMIDVDGFCWANPARDVGNLLAYLDWKAIRLPEHADFVERAQEAFLGGYETDRPRPAEPWLTLYRTASMLKIAGRRYRALSVDEWPFVPKLLAAARERLAA